MDWEQAYKELLVETEALRWKLKTIECSGLLKGYRLCHLCEAIWLDKVFASFQCFCRKVKICEGCSVQYRLTRYLWEKNPEETQEAADIFLEKGLKFQGWVNKQNEQKANFSCSQCF